MNLFISQIYSLLINKSLITQKNLLQDNVKLSGIPIDQHIGRNSKIGASISKFILIEGRWRGRKRENFKAQSVALLVLTRFSAPVFLWIKF